MIQFKRFVFNMFYENTYILWDDESMESAVIDPGCSTRSEEMEIKQFIGERSLKIKYLINTHCHIDHIFGCQFFKENYSPLYYIPEQDLPLLKNSKIQAEMVGVDFSIDLSPDEYLSENLKLYLGKYSLEFLFTPGHTPGEYCIYVPDEKICLTGDVLFFDSIGRTDLWGGDYDTLMKSIRGKLLILPEQTRIYPGHGDESSILREKNYNPFLQ